MANVRLGIIGLGIMGAQHASNILAGKIRGLDLVAVADRDPARLALAPGVAGFETGGELIGSGLVDAVLIATPHYDHVPLGIAALEAGRHLLVEKPVAVHKAAAARLIAAHAGRECDQVFGAMFNQRTDARHQRIRQLIRSGELGEIRRVNWIVTHWYRTAAYYASGGWRATWAGEGGGVLLNQLPHHLDLFHWLFGRPARLRAHCRFGQYHDIEVEDDVTAYLEFPNGATGVMIASTGEAPGTNRLEITAENGRLVYEDGVIRITRNVTPMSEFSRTSPQPFARPETREEVLRIEDRGGMHNGILQNFTDAIIDRVPLLAPGVEGIHSVEIANAMLLSTWTDRTVELPIDATEYERELQRRIKASRARRGAAGTDGNGAVALDGAGAMIS